MNNKKQITCIRVTTTHMGFVNSTLTHLHKDLSSN